MTAVDARSTTWTQELGAVGEYRGAEDRRLRYGLVRAERERHVLVYLHGIESHAGWFLPAADALRDLGVTTYLLDRRGSGLNREGDVGDASSADVLLEDVRRFRAGTVQRDHALVGLSWGGKLALASALRDPDHLRGLVLVTPGLVPRVDLTAGQKLRLLLSLPFGGRARLRIPIEAEMFTDTPRHLEFIRNDVLRLRRVTARFLMASHALDRFVRRGVRSLHVPTLLFLAGHDRIIDNKGTRAFLDRAPEGLVHVHEYEHATHSIQLDQTEDLVRDIHAFLEVHP